MHTDLPLWQVRDRFLDLRSRWLTLIGEHLLDDRGQLLEYWRVERAHSVIVMPIQSQRILLPVGSYRPGIGKATLDFPGGRLPSDQTPETAAIAILERELGVGRDRIIQLECLDPQGWPINSSFSDQLLYGFIAQIDPKALIPVERLALSVEQTPAGLDTLLKAVPCLQCRAVLLNWVYGVGRAQQDSNL